jgi:hypothetical protein
MTGRRPPIRPLRWWVVLIGVALTGLAIAASTWWLLSEANQAAPEKRAELRIAAIRTGLTVGAGTGGAFALLLATRRQWLQERAQAHQEDVALNTEFDATERRITELYTKAVDQLGSDSVPMRLGGLYALERLAQGNPDHRQTIVDVICAYLRQKYQGDQEELLVRTTAQRILRKHLNVRKGGLSTEWPRRTPPDDPQYWPDIELDLTEATLVEFEFAHCRVKTATFTRATFLRGANFAHTDFDEQVFFTGARFEDGAGHFLGAWFGLRAVFWNTDFGPRKAVFDYATFCGMANFDGAAFAGGMSLVDARALADFATGWGDTRWWPPGWREVDAGPLPRPPRGRWAHTVAEEPHDWLAVVREDR